MAAMRKLKAVRSIVRPDRRDDYLQRWREYARSAQASGAKVWLYEDQALPGRFFEFTEHEAAAGREADLERAFQLAELRRCCVRREGDDILYREVVCEEPDEPRS